MALTEDEVFQKTLIRLDSRQFNRCTFEECVLLYTGAGTLHMKDCNIIRSTWKFEGPAENTMQFLGALYQLSPSLVEAAFDAIRQGKPHLFAREDDEFPDTIS